MRDRIFGWSLPPGCSMRDIEGDQGPCEVCGIEVGNCICPECPKCGSYGDPHCYEKHGLVRTQAQIDSRKAYDDARAADAQVEEEWAEWERQSRQQYIEEESRVAEQVQQLPPTSEAR